MVSGVYGIHHFQPVRMGQLPCLSVEPLVIVLERVHGTPGGSGVTEMGFILSWKRTSRQLSDPGRRDISTVTNVWQPAPPLDTRTGRKKCKIPISLGCRAVGHNSK